MTTHEKALEAATEAAKELLEIDGDISGPFIRFDSIDAATEAAVTAYLSALLPEDAAYDSTGYDAVMEVVEFVMAEADRRHATALAAKDAELTEAKAQLQRQFDQTVRFQGYLVEAKAQLAEADRKIAEKDRALEPFAKLASEVDYLRHEDGSTSLHRLYARDLRAARRALEAQGGENG